MHSSKTQRLFLQKFNNKYSDWVLGVLTIGVLHALFTYIQFEYLTIFNTTRQMAVFFIPAAVRVFSVMLFGYWAGLGIAIGMLIHDGFLHPLPVTSQELLISIIQQSFGVSLSLFLWTFLSSKINNIKNPHIDFDRIDALDVFAICLIQAVVNTNFNHIFYIWSPSLDLYFDWLLYAVMFIGDLTGAFFFFILSNIIFSMLLRYGVIRLINI